MTITVPAKPLSDAQTAPQTLKLLFCGLLSFRVYRYRAFRMRYQLLSLMPRR
jgi:hypothetical protein